MKVTAGCIDCGFNAHPEALDFDHRPGEIKCFIITLGYNKSRERVLAEMAKCDVRCANCHRMIHRVLRDVLTVEKLRAIVEARR